MSALASFDKPLKVHGSRKVSCHAYNFMEMQTKVTVKWELKKAYNRFISNDTHDLRDPYFPKSVLNTTNEHCKCEGQKQYNMVHYIIYGILLKTESLDNAILAF